MTPAHHSRTVLAVPHGSPGSPSLGQAGLQQPLGGDAAGGTLGHVVATSAGAWASGGCTAQIGARDAGGRTACPHTLLAPSLSRRE